MTHGNAKMANQLELQLGSATMWDAMEHVHGGFSIRHRTIAHLRCLREHDRAMGPAYTIRLRRAAHSSPANRASFLSAMDAAPKGAVVVIEVQTDIGGVAMGDLVAHRLAVCQVAGVVIEGAIRDRTGLLDLAPATWYRYTTPAGPVTREICVEVNVDVVVDGAVIHAGDLLTADADGIVVTPRDEADTTIHAAAAIASKENLTHERLSAKESLLHILTGD